MTYIHFLKRIMQATAKVFQSGNSQAIRLPKAFRVDVSEMWIRRNELTQEITLLPKEKMSKKQRQAELMRMLEECAANPDDGFMFRPLDKPIEYARNPFADDDPA
jgi:antitoxin VapB